MVSNRIHLYIISADPATNLLASGPYGLIFASFVPFFFDIPVSTRFRVFGVRFSDKSFIYLAGLQVQNMMIFKCSYIFSSIQFRNSYLFLFCSSFYHPGEDLCCQEYVASLLVLCIV